MRPASLAVLCLLGIVVLPANSPKHKYTSNLVNSVLRIVLREALDVSHMSLAPLCGKPADSLLSSQPDEDMQFSELMAEVLALEPSNEAETLSLSLNYIVSSIGLPISRRPRADPSSPVSFRPSSTRPTSPTSCAPSLNC